ncbi:CCA tRNA nucleotidyltransferase [Candidatus Woesearchaeota archaeon]|nr:CCA tRNA nucleotidyltransferase [Candidatus Woesearchaeota archaeon]
MSMKLDLNRVISGLKPSSEEAKAANNAVNDFKKKLKVRNAELKVGGSFAKGTWIAGMHDIDIFACFDYRKYSSSSDSLSDLLERHISGLNYRRIHGSRDYFEARHGKYSLEIIPILNITKSSQAKNITDVSILHTKWVRANINESLADQVRLLKAFCIAQKCYGAESYIRGFSGYVCEILTRRYGSFINVLKAQSRWNEGTQTIIDLAGYYKHRNALSSLNASKTQGPLVIIDPVQMDRNAAAAISLETLERFRLAARKFIKKPAESFFYRESPTAEGIVKKNSDKRHKVIALQATPLDGKKDVTFSKILKAAEHIRKQMAFNGFKVQDSGIEWNDNPVIWIKTDIKISEETTISGPPIGSGKHSSRFKRAHRKTFAKGGRLYAKSKRKCTEPMKMISSIIKEQYVRERVKKVIIHD